MPVDVYFSDHDITGGEMTNLENQTPVAGITSRRAGGWWEAAIFLYSLGRAPIQARIDADVAKVTLRTALSWNGTRVAAVKRF